MRRSSQSFHVNRRASRVLGELTSMQNPLSAKSQTRIKSILNTEQFDSFFNKPLTATKAPVKANE